MQDTRQKEFNDEPVFYCKHCLSLAIISLEGLEFCDSCGSVDIKEDHINNWETEYKEKYGVEYLNTNKNGRKK